MTFLPRFRPCALGLALVLGTAGPLLAQQDPIGAVRSVQDLDDLFYASITLYGPQVEDLRYFTTHWQRSRLQPDAQRVLASLSPADAVPNANPPAVAPPLTAVPTRPVVPRAPAPVQPQRPAAPRFTVPQRPQQPQPAQRTAPQAQPRAAAQAPRRNGCFQFNGRQFCE